MTYLPTAGPPVLIARRGYGGLGAAADRNDGVKYDKSGNLVRTQPAAPAASKSTLDKIGSFLSDAGGAVIKFYNAQQQARGQQQAYAQMAYPPPSSMPGWVVPAAVGGIGLVVAVAVLSRRKNPARRRPRRRRRR